MEQAMKGDRGDSMILLRLKCSSFKCSLHCSAPSGPVLVLILECKGEEN